MNYYNNEADADAKTVCSVDPGVFSVRREIPAKTVAALKVHDSIWCPARAVNNAEGKPSDFTRHEFGYFKIEDDLVTAFNGESFWQKTITQFTPEIKALINAFHDA